MDYDALDREMSSWLISCLHNGTRFYLTDDDLGTDLLGRATRHRWLDDAEAHAADQRRQRAWQGFDWRPISVADVVISPTPAYPKPPGGTEQSE